MYFSLSHLQCILLQSFHTLFKNCQDFHFIIINYIFAKVHQA